MPDRAGVATGDGVAGDWATGDGRRIDRLPPGEIHAVGAAGLETASMVRYLIEGGREDIVLHDIAVDFEAAYFSAHRLQPADNRARSWAALRRCRDLRTGPDYLADVESAGTVLVPVSWFLQPANARLEPLLDRFVYYSDACFDLWPGAVIAVTGSFGKTTTSRFAAALVDGPCCGNDRESFSDLVALARAPSDGLMAFEASNRHLRNGFRRIVDVGVLTGITLNHEPDHGSFEAYRQAKYSLAARSCHFLYHAEIPGAFADAAAAAALGMSFGDGGDWRLAADTVVSPDGRRCPMPGVASLPALDRDNALAAAAAALSCGVPAAEVERRSHSLVTALPRYRHASTEAAGLLVVNDAASCTPASTAALVRRLGRRFALICGGDRQRYRPGEFDGLAAAVAGNRHAVLVCTIGAMAGNIAAALRAAGFDRIARCADLAEAVERAVHAPVRAVVFSPGCGTGTTFADKYVRGEAFDHAVSAHVSGGQAVS